MAEAVVSMVMGMVQDMLVEEAKFLYGVKKEVQELEAEFVRMQCFLKDAAKRQQESELIRNHVSEIRNLSYRAQDVLDAYALDVASRRKGGGIGKVVKRFSGFLSEGLAVHNIGKEILDIKSRLKNIGESLQNYGIKEEDIVSKVKMGLSNSDEQRLRKTYGHEVEDHFVGMKEDLNQVMDYLLDRIDARHRVVSISGMGGLGKTTLARKVYNHEKIRRAFDSFAWVCISQECDLKVALGDILRQLLPRDEKDRVKAMEENEMVEEVHRVLKGRKCLVLIDDIWKLNHWQLLKPAFPLACNGSMSKFLLTTRNEKVGEIGTLHKLRLLCEDDAWELLKFKAFQDQEVPESRIQSEFEAIGREIVQKCGYLPLVVSIIGGLLNKSKNDPNEWERVKSDIDSYVRRGDGIEREKQVHQVLDLSYTDLPYYLKPCFLYLGGAFKEDQNIFVDDLYLLWIAEGMVLSEHKGKDETMMDVAERYLNELAVRCLVEVERDELIPSRKYQWCHLHDLVRELSLEKATQEDFRIKFTDFSQYSTSPVSDNTLSLHDKTRRLAISLDKRVGPDEIATFVHRMSRQLRSLVLLAPSFSSVPIGLIHCEKYLKLLKVLIFENIDFDHEGTKRRKLLQSIGKISNLRYLKFKQCYIDKFPSSISNLACLQTLQIDVFFRHTELKIPDVLWKLTQLKQLHLPRGFRRSHHKLRLDGLDQLEILDGFSSNVHSVSSLSQLKNLKRLYAHVERDNDALSFIVDRMHHLQWLELVVQDSDFSTEQGVALLERMFSTCPSLQHLVINGKISKLPKCDDCYSKTLFHLELRNSKLEEDPMKILGKFPSLRSLELSNAFEGREMVCLAMGFPQLRSLRLCDLDKLNIWRIEGGSMPNLSSLSILYCYGLVMLPVGLRYISNLKQLEIKFMPDWFYLRLTKGGQDFDKVQHIPYVDIGNDFTKKLLLCSNV